MMSNPLKVMAAVLPDKNLQVWEMFEPYLLTRWKASTEPSAGWTNWIEFQRMINTGIIMINFSDISWVPLSNGIPQLFAISGGKIYTCWKASTDPGAKWTTWSEFPMPATGAYQISGVSLTNGVPQLFAIDTAKVKIYTCWKASTEPSAGWTKWSEFPNPSIHAYQISGVSLTNGVPQLFVTCSNDITYTCWKASTDPGAKWTNWSEFPRPSNVFLEYISWVPLSNGVPQLFAIGTDGKIYTCWKASTDPGAKWTQWTNFQMPSSVQVTNISGASLSNGVPQLFAIGTDGKIYTCWKASTDPGAKWTEWGLY
jgi:hypothetical protein